MSNTELLLQTKSKQISITQRGKKPQHCHEGNYAHKNISGLVQALHSLVSDEKSSWKHSVREYADCHSRGGRGYIRPGQERAKLDR